MARRLWHAGGDEGSDITVPPLPLGPKERAYFEADGETEMGSAEDLGLDSGEPPRELYYYVPSNDGGAGEVATRAELPYRNTKGDIVDRETWTADYEASLWPGRSADTA